MVLVVFAVLAGACGSQGARSRPATPKPLGILHRLVPISTNLAVTNRSGWDALPAARQAQVESEIRARAVELTKAALHAKITTSTPSLNVEIMKRRTRTSARTTRVAAPKSAAPKSGATNSVSVTSFDSSAMHNATPLLNRSAFTGLPCVTVSIKSSEGPLVACGGFVRPFDSANRAAGLVVNGLLASGDVAFGSTSQVLQKNFDGLESVRSRSSRYVAARFAVTTISIYVGSGVRDSCGHRYVIGAAWESAYRRSPSQVAPQRNQALNDCSSTLSAHLAPGSSSVVNDLASVGRSAVSAVDSAASTPTAAASTPAQCARVDNLLAYAPLARSLAAEGITANAPNGASRSLTPGPGVYVSCTTTPVSWTSPTPIAGGTTLAFQVGGSTSAQVLAGSALSMTLSFVAGCISTATTSAGTRTACPGVTVPSSTSTTTEPMSGTTGGTSSDIACPSTTTCYAVGTNSSSEDKIFSTSTGGAKWTQVNAPSGVKTLSSISCPSITTCYAVGAGSSGSGVVAATTDGGSSWRQQVAPGGMYGLYGVACPSITTCYAVGLEPRLGESAFRAGVIVATINGGVTWTSENTPQGVSQLNAISCPSTTTCYAAGGGAASGVIVVTTDGGFTWSTQSATAAVGVAVGVACPSTTTCHAVGNDQPGEAGLFLSTTLGGAAWVLVNTPLLVPTARTFDYVGGIACPSMGKCYVTSNVQRMSGRALSASVISTADGGSTWTNESPPSGVVSLSGVACPTTSVCYATGVNLFNSTIVISTADGGSTWATQGTL